MTIRQDEIPTYGGIFRGRAKIFQVTLTAPAGLGSYSTHWRMLQEGVAWFGEELVVPITVKVKTAATVTLSNLSQVADGAAKSASVTTTTPGLTVSLTYNGSVYAPASVGSYTVVGIINDANYQGRATNTLVITANPNLMYAHGSFEGNADGASVTSPPDVVDSTTIMGWRVFDVVSATVAFRASIIGNASAGSRAVSLEVTAAGDGSYGLDQWDVGMHTPVQPGTNYIVSFDAAWIAGATANNLVAYVNEFDHTGTYIGTSEDLGAVSVADTNYRTFVFLWKAVNPGTAEIGIGFKPLPGDVGTTALSLDNVRMEIPATLPMNGGFDYSPMGTSAGGAGGFIDTITFTGWRLFSVGAPEIISFTGTIVNAGNYTGGQPGNQAMRLDINNTGSPVGDDYGLDNDKNRISVTTGKKYTLSFDLALDGITGGTMAFVATIAEYDAAGTFTGTQESFAPPLPADQAFHHFSMDYVVQNPNTTQVVIAFRPRNSGFVSAVVLDYVVLAPFVPAANTVTVYRAKGSASQIKVAKIMSQEPLGLIFGTNSATTANGATLTSDATTIYVPASSEDDRFTYTVSDGLGGATANGTVLVKVGAPTGLPVTPFPNGSFESDAYNTIVGYGTPFIDTVTFANWRFFTVGSPPIAGFAGMNQDASSTDSHTVQGGVPGSHCMRLDVNNPDNPGGVDYALDRDNARVSVTYGVTYTFSFDAALYGLTGGSFTLGVSLPEFNGAGSFTGSQTSFTPTLDGAYRTYAYNWTPLNPATATIAPAFRLYSPGYACAMGLDNVGLHSPVANTDTINRAPGLPAQVSISNLLTNDTDTENHPLTFVTYSAATTNGATLTSDGTYIYVPATSVADSFTYKITDGLGATNSGTVLIPMVASFATTPTNIVFSLSGGTLALTWPGSHRGWYAQSNSVNLRDPTKWFNIPGSETVTNLNISVQPGKTNVFYRLRLP